MIFAVQLSCKRKNASRNIVLLIVIIALLKSVISAQKFYLIEEIEVLHSFITFNYLKVKFKIFLKISKISSEENY